MSDLKRRGFLTTLGAFFGAAPVIRLADGPEEAPAPADLAEVSALQDRPVLKCEPGDEIELECHGMRCRAILTSCEMEITAGVDVTSSRSLVFSPQPVVCCSRLAVRLTLQSCGEFTRV